MTDSNSKIQSKRRLKGIVTSNSMDKTVVVTVTTLKRHKKYFKYFKSSRKFKAHDAENAYQTGDNVMIEECRPLSKDKKWRVVGKI